MKKIYLALWIAVIFFIPSFAQLIDGGGTSPSQESYQLGLNQISLGARYSEYYTMLRGPAPAYHISVPVQFDITGTRPLDVYFSNQQQPVSFPQYQSGPTYNTSTSLWIQGTTNWTQYAEAPQGSTVSLIAVSPTGGSGNLAFVDADGRMYNYNYYFYPYSQMTFYADKPGRHTLSFTIGDMKSNAVVIDVTGANTATAPAGYPGAYQIT